MPGLEGTSLGRYRLKQRLGRGGMAEVYLATDERMRRDVAIKIVSTSQTEFAERFSRETEAMGNLHHDHILPAYDYGEQEPWRYLVMPYIAHGTLSDLLKQGALDLEHAGELLQQIASGLQYAHKRGLIHRDIKPSNILLRDDHYAYLADFGLARGLESGRDLTLTGTLLGTPEYMAPELAEGPAGISSDVYALAVVLYQMISGRAPFQGDSALSVFWKHIREYPRSPSHFQPLIPREIDHVLMRALEKDPQRRYPTALALSQAYQEALTGSGEMPSLYNTEILAHGQVQPGDPIPRLESAEQTQQERILLAGERAVSTPPGIKRPHPPITPPPITAQQAESPADPLTPGPAALPARLPLSRPRRTRGNRVWFGIAMGLAFLFVVSCLLAYLTIQSRQQHTVSATATARTDATNTARSRATQQVQNARQTATAGAGIATAQARATQQAVQATVTAITGSTPLLSDPLSGPDGNNWPNDGVSCSFTNNRYYVSANSADTLQPCISNSSNLQYGDAAFQVDATLISSDDAGLIFRTSADGNQFYDFEITRQGQFYFRYRDNGKYTFLIQPTASSAIAPVGNANTLLVIANGPDFQFFINGTQVGKAHDSTFTGGQLGVVSGTSRSSTHGNASFANLAVYKVG
ncbi:MAG TPA: protein kinase [Ktedonobacteraceae bacterium]|nr:protein kinase [Ktedonobacteraceae bacterium]